MQTENIQTEVNDQIMVITITRESKLNALNKLTLTELSNAISEGELNAAVRGIIITGAGEKAFVAGADISEFNNYSAAEGKELAKEGQAKVFDVIEQCSKPVIAAVNGFALGGGLELAMACHIRIASENARLGLPEVSLGLIPGYGGTQRLTQLVGKGKAIELIATADIITAQDALVIGLVNHVVPQTELMAKAIEILNKVKLRAPIAVANAIAAINAAGTEQGYETEIERFGACFSTEDFKEGTAAFIEKRKPVFTGH